MESFWNAQWAYNNTEVSDRDLETFVGKVEAHLNQILNGFCVLCPFDWNDFK